MKEVNRFHVHVDRVACSLRLPDDEQHILSLNQPADKIFLALYVVI